MGRGELHYDSTDKRYYIDLFVTATYNANETAWESSFRYASKILFDATKGQMQLGTVSFLNDSSSGADPNADAYLKAGNSDCQCFSYKHDRKAGDFELKGTMSLTRRSKIQPMVTVHELGHYACSLLDEYVGIASQRCIADASKRASIMEASFGRGIQLDDQGNELAANRQYKHIVNEFCYKNHVSCGLICTADNYQQRRHHQSCWHTLNEVFSVANVFTFRFPDDAQLAVGNYNPIDWVVRSDISKTGLFILGWELFVVQDSIDDVLNCVSTTSSLTAASANEYALEADPDSSRFVRNMNRISREESIELTTELKRIAASNQKLSPEKIQLQSLSQLSFGIGQFNEEPGSLQHIIVPVPGEYNLDLGDEKEEESAWKSINEQLREKQVRLSIVTLGKGKTAETANVASRNHWIDHVSILPADIKPKLHTFDYRNYLIQEFLDKEGWAFATLFDGVLPDLPLPTEDDEEKGEELKLEERYKKHFRFEPRTEGFDLPVLIEDDAKSAMFGLSEPESGQIQFTMLGPNGQVIDVETENAKRSVDEDDVTWLLLESENFELGGQWILRLRRKKTGKELPFHLIVAVRNDELSTEPVVKHTEKGTLFKCVAYYPTPLDFINVFVDIYDASDFHRNTEPVQSIVLRRESRRLKEGELLVELSTGGYQAIAQLSQGEYVAVFRVSGNPNAVSATNMGGDTRGSLLTEPARRNYSSFSRVTRQYFSVE